MIYSANQMAGFYAMEPSVFNGLKKSFTVHNSSLVEISTFCKTVGRVRNELLHLRFSCNIFQVKFILTTFLLFRMPYIMCWVSVVSTYFASCSCYYMKCKEDVYIKKLSGQYGTSLGSKVNSVYS